MKVRMKSLLLRIGFVAIVGVLSMLAVRQAMAGMNPHCSTYYSPCVINVSTCCLAYGGPYTTNTATGQTLSAIPVTPATQCAKQFAKKFFGYMCFPQTGLCGGAAHYGLCE